MFLLLEERGRRDPRDKATACQRSRPFSVRNEFIVVCDRGVRESQTELDKARHLVPVVSMTMDTAYYGAFLLFRRKTPQRGYEVQQAFNPSSTSREGVGERASGLARCEWMQKFR